MATPSEICSPAISTAISTSRRRSLPNAAPTIPPAAECTVMTPTTSKARRASSPTEQPRSCCHQSCLGGARRGGAELQVSADRSTPRAASDPLERKTHTGGEHHHRPRNALRRPQDEPAAGAGCEKRQRAQPGSQVSRSRQPRTRWRRLDRTSDQPPCQIVSPRVGDGACRARCSILGSLRPPPSRPTRPVPLQAVDVLRAGRTCPFHQRRRALMLDLDLGADRWEPEAVADR